MGVVYKAEDTNLKRPDHPLHETEVPLEPMPLLSE